MVLNPTPPTPMLYKRYTYIKYLTLQPSKYMLTKKPCTIYLQNMSTT